MQNTAFLTAEEEALYEDYRFLGIAAVKGKLGCSTDAANKEIRRILKLIRAHKAFEERQAIRFDKIQTAINQAKFDGSLSFKIMSI